MQKTKALLWLILLLCSFSAEAISYINKISYEGNNVTRATVLNREIYIVPGDEFNEELVEKSRQAIMDLGLFKSVTYYLQENYINGNDAKEGYQISVVFIVKEKYYLLIVPRLKLDDNQIYYGLQLKWDNIFGLNHEARALVEDRGSTRGIDENRYLFRYFFSNINDSYYNLGVSIKTENDVDETQGAVNREDDSFKISISRWLNKRGRNRGWFAGGSVLYQKRFNEDLIIDSNSEGINAIILGVDVGYKDTNNFNYNRGGKAYGYRLDYSHEAVGSEAEFTRHLLYYRSYYLLAQQPYSNLNVQFQLGHSNNDVLGDDAFSLGSSRGLRGYENSRFNGNTLLLTNVEYMFPHSGHPVVRYVTFIDVGNTYDELNAVLHEPLNIGAGFGIRWKIRSLVKIDLRADVGYGFTDEDYRFSFGTRHAF